MKKSKFLALGLAAIIGFSPIGATAQEVSGSPTPGKVFSHGGTGWVWAIFGCSSGIIVAAMVANYHNRRQLTWNEAATCGLLYWFYGMQQQTPPKSTTMSDMRLKRDIHLLATLDSGMKIYSFKYLWSDTANVGVMAQDLLAHPAWRDAVVTSPNGFYAVNYTALGLKMVTLEEWQAQGLASIKSERLSIINELPAIQPAL